MSDFTNLKWYALDVNPEPWAVGPVGYSRRNGKMSAYIGRNAQLDAYKQAVREAIGKPTSEIIEGRVQLVFLFWRNRAEYSTPQARHHRKHEADVTNLSKATEDALQGVLFSNDKNTNDIRSVLVEQGPNVKGKVIVGIARSYDTPSVMNNLPSYVYELIEELDNPMSPPQENNWDSEKSWF